MRRLSRTLAFLSLAVAAPALTACTTEAVGGDDGARGVGGKADDTEVNCDDTGLDDAGVCRRDNGQFAPAVCCAEEAKCANATIDDGGSCRDSESGQFVPAKCCDDLCADARVINGFCRDANTGQFALAACCADQCFDLQGPSTDPEDAPPGSCEGSCGDQAADGECFCDDLCLENNDCCADALELCAEDVGAEPPAANDEDNSCADSCGGPSPSESCFCDEVCADLGDCCGDKVAQCGGEGSDAIIACEVDECEGAEVDENFVCRKPNGQFALAACCGLDRCDNADLETAEDGSALCRDDASGQFIPMVCCEQRCDGAGMDRNGICRNGETGEFADPSCCADQCFAAQERGNADRVDACNGTQERPL